jgi:hypothetical protein
MAGGAAGRLPRLPATLEMNGMILTALRLLRHEQAQDTFEYLLVLGAVMVVIVAGLFIGFQTLLPEVVGWICPSVDTAVQDPGFKTCFG